MVALGMESMNAKGPLKLDVTGWFVVVVGVIITASLSIGVHDLAITYFGIPYPKENTVPSWARFARYMVGLGGLVFFLRAASAWLHKKSYLSAMFALGLLLSAFSEVVRNIVIEWKINDGWHGDHWAYILSKHLPRTLGYFYQAGAAIVIVRLVSSHRHGLAAIAIGIASLIGFLVVSPSIGDLRTYIQSEFTLTSPPDIFSAPYPLEVYLYIYGMFLEPAVAALLLAIVAWRGLPAQSTLKILAFVLIVLCLRGDIVTTTVYPFWSPQPLIKAILSEAQFFVESLLLGLLSATTWKIASQRYCCCPLKA